MVPRLFIASGTSTNVQYASQYAVLAQYGKDNLQLCKEMSNLPAVQRTKKTIRKIAPQDLGQSETMARVDVDLIGPMKIKTPSQEVELRALTMIDPATGWFEVKDVVSPSAEDCMAANKPIALTRVPHR
jgi:hypothetical protein